jgi:hypothetical protein
LDLQFSKYDCILGQVPPEENLLKIDAIIITGSCKLEAMDKVSYHFSDVIHSCFSLRPSTLDRFSHGLHAR